MLQFVKTWWDSMVAPDLPVLKEMPAHVRDLNIDGMRVFLHVDASVRPNPDVDATPWIGGGNKPKGRRK